MSAWWGYGGGGVETDRREIVGWATGADDMLENSHSMTVSKKCVLKQGLECVARQQGKGWKGKGMNGS